MKTTTLATISATLVCSAFFAGCSSDDSSSGDAGAGGSATAGSGGTSTAGTGGTGSSGKGGTGSSGKGGSAGGTAGSGGTTGGSAGTAGAGGTTGGSAGTAGAGGTTGGSAGTAGAGGTAGGSTGGSAGTGGTAGGAGGATGGSGGTAGGAGGSTGGSGGLGGAAGGTAAPDTSCLAAIPADPKPANNTITFDFTILDYLAKTPLQGATLKACAKTDTACATPLAMPITDATGKATFTFDAGPDGFDGYLDTTGVDKHVPTLIFFSHHVIGNPANANLAYGSRIFSTTIFNAATAGKVMLDPTRGHVVNVIHDCAYTAASGATVTASAADAMSKTIYAAGAALSTTATATDANGAAFIFNLPAGPTTITDKYMSSTLGAHDVFTRAGSLTDIQMYPMPLPLGHLHDQRGRGVHRGPRPELAGFIRAPALHHSDRAA